MAIVHAAQLFYVSGWWGWTEVSTGTPGTLPSPLLSPTQSVGPSANKVTLALPLCFSFMWPEHTEWLTRLWIPLFIHSIHSKKSLTNLSPSPSLPCLRPQSTMVRGQVFWGRFQLYSDEITWRILTEAWVLLSSSVLPWLHPLIPKCASSGLWTFVPLKL